MLIPSFRNLNFYYIFQRTKPSFHWFCWGAKPRKPMLTCRESPPSQPVNKNLHSYLNFIFNNFLHHPNPKILNLSLFLKLGLNITWNQVVKSQIIIFNIKIFFPIRHLHPRSNVMCIFFAFSYLCRYCGLPCTHVFYIFD